MLQLNSLKKIIIFGVASLSFVVVEAKIARAADFKFTSIAESRGQFSSVGLSSVINEQGTVAFEASLASGGNGIFTNNNGIINKIVDTNDKFDYFVGYAINDSSTVGFVGQLKGLSLEAGGRGVYTGDGKVINTITDTNGRFENFYEPSINNDGTIAVGAIRDGDGLGIYAFKEGSIINIYEKGSRAPSINNDGTVALWAFLTQDNLAIVKSDGKTITTVADSTSGLKNLQSPAINDRDTIVFRADIDTRGSGAFIGSNGSVRNFADTSGSYNVIRATSINNKNEVAFGADLDTGGEGVFIGPNSITDKVIATGDTLFGSTVTNVYAFSNNFINDRGQIVFSAELTDGRRVIARAEPSSKSPTDIPEPNFLFGLIALLSLGIFKKITLRGATNQRARKF
jgi:hypothetical protein